MDWPNAHSHANSDGWLIAHHDAIRRLRPRVLAVNYVSDSTEDAARTTLDAFARAITHATNGCIEPQLHAILDRTQPAGAADRNSAQWPRESDGVHFDYGALIGELDPADDINEIWVLGDHSRASEPWETVEVKATYDEQFTRIGHTRFAGNCGEHSAPWLGRSLRVTYLNHFRGAGCALENLGHTLERTATSNAIPYFTRYFTEYAMLDLDTRFGLPFSSLYEAGAAVDYPSPTTLRYRDGWRRKRVENYVVAGGNVHFMPNGRRDYDLENTQRVHSTIASWRRPGEQAVPWTPQHLTDEHAPDCMGRWLVEWCRHMPGPDSRALDDAGHAMKNWWPFLYY